MIRTRPPVACFLSIVPMVLWGCAPGLREYFPDAYYEQDNVYENKSIGFSLTYRGNWVIDTDPNEMTKTGRSFARELQRAGAELLFVGATVEATQGTRGVAANLNEPPAEHAELIRRLNARTIDEDFGITDFFTPSHAMVKWEYRIGEFRFAEFFFCIDTYNIRIAFWTRPMLYENFLPVYEDIISSLAIVSRL
jgi:hypothetical protein